MDDSKTPEFERKPEGRDIFWVQDYKTKGTPPKLMPGCTVTAKYRGVTTVIKLLEVVDENELIGEIKGFEPPRSIQYKEFQIGDRVKLSMDHIFTCEDTTIS